MNELPEFRIEETQDLATGFVDLEELATASSGRYLPFKRLSQRFSYRELHEAPAEQFGYHVPRESARARDFVRLLNYTTSTVVSSFCDSKWHKWGLILAGRGVEPRVSEREPIDCVIVAGGDPDWTVPGWISFGSVWTETPQTVDPDELAMTHLIEQFVSGRDESHFAELEGLAEKALQRIRERPDQIDSWADGLADDVSNATD